MKKYHNFQNIENSKEFSQYKLLHFVVSNSFVSTRYKLATIFTLFALFFVFIDAEATEYDRLNNENCSPLKCQDGLTTKIKTNSRTIMYSPVSGCAFNIYFDVDSVYCPSTNLSYKYMTLQRIEFLNDDALCNNSDIKSFVQLAILTLTSESDLYLHYPGVVPVIESINIKMPACMKKIYNSNNILKNLVPCDTLQCCEITLNIRRDESGVYIDTSSSDSQINCNNILSPTQISACNDLVYICGIDPNNPLDYNLRHPNLYRGQLSSYPSCGDYSPLCQWTVPQNSPQFEVVKLNGCEYYVYYSMRRNTTSNCGGICNTNELRFHKIISNGNSSCNLNTNQTLDMVLKYFLKNAKTIMNRNFGVFPNNNPYTCFDWNDTLKVYMQNCWDRYGINGLYRYLPCLDECCEQEFRFDQSGNQINVYALNTIPTDTCASSCSYVCNLLNLNNYSFYLSKVGVENDDVEQNNYFIIKNNKISFDIDLEIESNQSVNLLIYDINGRLIQTNKFEKENNSKTFTTYIDNIKSGLYLYSIIYNNYTLNSGKFIKED